MTELTITGATGTAKCIVDLLDAENSQNFTVMEYQKMTSAADIAFTNLLDGHFQRKTETNKFELADLAQAAVLDVTWRNQANGATGTWFSFFSGSSSISASV